MTWLLIYLKRILDVPFIIDEIFKQILDNSLKFDPDFANIRKLLSGVNADLFELKSSFGLDFFQRELLWL